MRTMSGHFILRRTYDRYLGIFNIVATFLIFFIYVSVMFGMFFQMLVVLQNRMLNMHCIRGMDVDSPGFHHFFCGNYGGDIPHNKRNTNALRGDVINTNKYNRSRTSCYADVILRDESF